MTSRLLLVGCGKMGGALLAGWLDRGIAAADVVVVEPAVDPSRISLPDGVTVVADAAGIPASFAPDVLIMAVKPQVMGEAAPAYAGHAAGAVTLSIAAGTPVAFFQDLYGDDAAIVRVMPNTPAAVGRGMSVLYANDRTSDAQRVACEGLMAAVGETAWIGSEEQMDAVTAVSGSGPAYVFLLIEALAAAGEKAGLDAGLATTLALNTVAGAGELARLSDEAAAQLRINVTSPGGTTQAALEVLMAEDGMPALLERAVDAAARRSRELA